MSTEILTGENALQVDQAGLDSYLNHVLKRRSIRKLTAGPVSDETIRAIAEAGRWSASSGNSQPARIVILKERNTDFWNFVEQTLSTKLQGEQLERAIARLAGYRSGVFTIVVYEDTTISHNPPAGFNPELWKNFAAQALGIFQANLWNAISAAGLGASNQHINFQIEEELRSFLHVPETWQSYCILPVGFPAETPAEGSRHPHEKVVFYENGPAE
ncbi:nitroreductase family protein [Tengunoibacter tsumagoiensis]|uniref:Nitroreductase n=1 Tax=Tengunoibacter tsumagoiensis TaxID=2014871 RepID=A0A401ZXL5_9CHLR|nr:nitroreductase family protein [Tengunoibacter tsumagoiensis]GCE11596.1 nitroreductase [Tengunoibacter tsumagoiensis]